MLELSFRKPSEWKKKRKTKAKGKKKKKWHGSPGGTIYLQKSKKK